jgi:HK97 family phage major capsid protein
LTLLKGVILGRNSAHALPTGRFRAALRTSHGPISRGLSITAPPTDRFRAVWHFLLNVSGTAGQPTGLLNVVGVNSIVFTSTAPKFIDTAVSGNSFYNRLVNAIQQVTTKRFASPSAILMHPARWAWVQEAMDTTGRPYVLGENDGPFNAGGISDPGQIAQGKAGNILGLPVILDASIPVNLGTGLNQDVVFVAKFDDVWTWEGNVRAEAYEQTYATNLSPFIRLYNYVSIQGQRYPQSVSVISGTGLVAPTL